jgi:hypothetical protein
MNTTLRRKCHRLLKSRNVLLILIGILLIVAHLNGPTTPKLDFNSGIGKELDVSNKIAVHRVDDPPSSGAKADRDDPTRSINPLAPVASLASSTSLELRLRTTRWEPLHPYRRNLFVLENSTDFVTRYQRWRTDAIRHLSDPSMHPNIRYVPFGVQQPASLSIFLRSAIIINSTIFAMIPMEIPYYEFNATAIQTFLDRGCKIGGVTCKCEIKHCSCGSKYSQRSSRIACKVDAKIPDDAEEVELGNNELQIPIERLPRSGNDLHVCYQQYLFDDPRIPPLPKEVMETYFAHYARYGATHLHVFAKENRWVEWFKSLRIPRKLTLWIHDSPFPSDYPNLPIRIGAYQLYLATECHFRAYSMGARWTIMNDFDELLVLNDRNRTSNSIAEVLDNYPAEKKVIWFPTRTIDSKTCVSDRHGNKPNGFHNYLEHMVFAYKSDPLVDHKTRARIKGVLRTGLITPDFLINLMYLTHHQLPGPPSSMFPLALYEYKYEVSAEKQSLLTGFSILHYREIYSADACRVVLNDEIHLPPHLTLVRMPETLPGIDDMFD